MQTDASIYVFELLFFFCIKSALEIMYKFNPLKCAPILEMFSVSYICSCCLIDAYDTFTLFRKKVNPLTFSL